MSWILAEEESGRGSSDPFFARTILQAGRILPFYELGKEREHGVAGVLNRFRRHMHQCDAIARRIVGNIEEGSLELESHLRTRDPASPLRLPAAGNLTNDIETFLYHSRLALRELKGIFEPTLGKPFKDTTRYTNIAEWSTKRFGRDNTLTGCLGRNCDWVEKLLASRNAIEHPGRHELKILNFRVDGSRIRGPTWRLDGESPKSVLHDMKILPENLLVLSELLLLYSLQNVKDISPFVIAEIPEERRNPAVPVRFIATLPQDVDDDGFYMGWA